jgi:hypothetical protein
MATKDGANRLDHYYLARLVRKSYIIQLFQFLAGKLKHEGHHVQEGKQEFSLLDPGVLRVCEH